MTQRLDGDTELDGDIVISIGAERTSHDVDGAPSGSSRKPPIVRWLPVAAVVAVLGVVALTADRSPVAPASTAEAMLRAPSEPPGARQVTPEAGTQTLPSIALGWRAMDLPGWNPALDVGESGWLIGVSGGDAGVIALTSTNGLDWHPATLPVAGWQLSVHSGTSGLWVSALGESGTTTFRSVNGGGSWATIPLPDDEAWLVGMDEAGGEMYAYGKTGTTDPWTSGRPAVWMVEKGAWVARELSASVGWVGGVATWNGVPYAFGSESDRPAVWDLRNGVRIEVDPPRGGGFIAARSHDGRLWGIVSADVWTNGPVYVADGLDGWSQVKVTAGTRLETVGADLAVVHDSSFTVLSASPVVVTSGRSTDPDTGWRDVAYLTGLGSALNTTAMVGDSLAGGSRFYLRMSWPVDQPDLAPRIVLDPSQIAWVDDTRWPEDWGPLAPFVAWDGSFYTFNPSRLGVLRLTVGTGAPTVEWSAIGALTVTDGWASFSVTDQGLYVTTAAGLFHIDGDRLTPVDLPVGGPAQAATVDGKLSVATANNVLWTEEDGSWTEIGRSFTPVIGSIPGAFVVATSTGWGVTTDGTNVDDTPGLRGWWTGSPFLIERVAEGATTVRLVTDWPAGDEVVIPTESQLVDVRGSGDRIWVRTAEAVLVSSDAGASWTSIPAAFENGLPSDAQLIPASEPLMYGSLSGGGYALYRPGARR